MINLGIYDEVKEMLFQNGKDICQIEEVEPEPSLGNGGLGRLAACFLDSIATLGLPGDGIGLNYHLGLFKQEFKDHLQKELPNPWIEKQSWLTKTDVVYPVSFRGLKVNARMYAIRSGRDIMIRQTNCTFLTSILLMRESWKTEFILIKKISQKI